MQRKFTVPNQHAHKLGRRFRCAAVAANAFTRVLPIQYWLVVLVGHSGSGKANSNKGIVILVLIILIVVIIIILIIVMVAVV